MDLYKVKMHLQSACMYLCLWTCVCVLLKSFELILVNQLVNREWVSEWNICVLLKSKLMAESQALTRKTKQKRIQWLIGVHVAWIYIHDANIFSFDCTNNNFYSIKHILHFAHRTCFDCCCCHCSGYYLHHQKWHRCIYGKLKQKWELNNI